MLPSVEPNPRGPMKTATITPDSSALNLALSQPTVSAEEDRKLEPLSVPLLESESNFYNQYPWSIQVFPRLREIREHLISEISRVPSVQIEWQRQEVSINVFLFSGAFLESVDEFLLGKSVDLS